MEHIKIPVQMFFSLQRNTVTISNARANNFGIKVESFNLWWHKHQSITFDAEDKEDEFASIYLRIKIKDGFPLEDVSMPKKIKEYLKLVPSFRNIHLQNGLIDNGNDFGFQISLIV